MRSIRTALAVVLEKHAGMVNTLILAQLRMIYGELAAVVPPTRLRWIRRVVHLRVAEANALGYSDFVADMVSVDDAFIEELADD